MVNNWEFSTKEHFSLLGKHFQQGEKTMKTYSRVKAKQQLTDDVFTENAQETLKGNLPSGIFSDDEKQRYVDGRRKRGRNKSAVTGSGKQKKLKQGTLKKKSISEVKVQKSESVTSLSPPTDINYSDVLFGEGLPPVKKKRQSRAKKQKACTPKQKGRQKRNSASEMMTEKSQPSHPKKNMSKNGNKNSSDEAELLHNQLSSDSIIEAELPSGTQARPEDKVSDWLAKSDECSHTSQDDTSKEVFRGAQSLTGDEMRCRLFPQEFFDNLNCVLERRPSAQAGQNVKARKDEFLSQLALKTGNKQQSYLHKAAPTEKLYSVSDIDDEDVMIMCRSTQSGLQTGLQTETGTSMTTSMGTSKSNGQTGTGTLMTTNTGSSKYTGTETGTQMETGTLMTSGTGTSKFTDTRTGTNIKTVTSSFPSEAGTSRLTETRSDSPTGASSQFVSGASSADKITLSSKKKHYKVDSNEVSDSLKLKGQRVQKYLCSTMRRSTSLNNADFPSELSAVTDSLRNQQREEKTPRKTEEDFKVPGSPTKSTAFKGIRKGILQPKNSTKLFTTGFVEIFDAIPQMSTIVCDNKSKVTVIENDDEQLPCEPKQKMQNIRSSTPNKGDTQGQAFQFEIDISSVNFDSGDEDLLHFHESREVNSEECIQLSTTLIDSQQDKVEVNDTLKYVDNISNAGKNLSPTTECIKESPKSNKQRDLKKPKNAAIVKSKVINKRGRKTLKSRELRNNVRKRSSSGLARVMSRSDFNRRRSSRISASNYTTKASINKTDDEDVTIVKNSRNAISQDLRKAKKSENVESYEIVQPDTLVKDVYDIDNSDIVASNVITADKDASLNDDVFDIEESALNVPDAETQKMARKNYCTIFTRRSKRTSSEIYFHPKGLLDFNTRSYSSVDSRSVNNLFIVERKGSENKQICPKGSKPSKRDCISICSLMNEDFTCPQKKISIVRYIATDTRSREEILATVPVDSLMS